MPAPKPPEFHDPVVGGSLAAQLYEGASTPPRRAANWRLPVALT
jgi:hypothetical protein